jgi:hypothetical protein
MIQSATPPIRCYAPVSLPLEAAFDAPRLTSDGGLVWVAEADAALGLCSVLAAAVPDWRTGPVTHRLALLIRQRVFQIACGYEDQDDADRLRTDPLFKLACGRFPTDPDLASQPTLSRLENAIDYKTCYRLGRVLLAQYLQERGRAGTPRRILIDADSTDDPAHGEQEGSADHGFYEQHMFHPLLLTDGDTDDPITAILRPGTCHASHRIVAALKRVVRAIRARFPGVPILFRGDSGFAIPQVYDYLEAAAIPYAIALIPNTRLRPLADERLAEAKTQSTLPGQKARLFGEARYAAASWTHERRVVFKTEWLKKGPNVRFVVTTRVEDPARGTLYLVRAARRQSRRLHQGSQAWLLRRPALRSPLLGQPIPALPARRRLLAPPHRSTLADAAARGADAARHLAPVADQDRRLAPPPSHPDPPPPRRQSSG